MNKDQLADLFKPFGEIIQSKILVDQYTGFSKGAGFILFRCYKMLTLFTFYKNVIFWPKPSKEIEIATN